MRILFVGDVFGEPGCAAVAQHLPRMVADWRLDLVVVNGENASGQGFGINRAAFDGLLAAGADVVTLGNHTWDDPEVLDFIDEAPQLLRPLNCAPGSPGRGAAVFDTRNGEKALVVNALGRVFMAAADNPFPELDRLLSMYRLGREVQASVVDFHCEATSEKQAAGVFCDGRASLVVGSHTHVPTADHRILPRGTGYLSDAGMTGCYESVIGMQVDAVMERLTGDAKGGRPLGVARGEGTLCGVALETDPLSGLALRIAPVRAGGSLAPAQPDFW